MFIFVSLANQLIHIHNFMQIKYKQRALWTMNRRRESNNNRNHMQEVQSICGSQAADIWEFCYTHLLHAYFTLINWRNRTLLYCSIVYYECVWIVFVANNTRKTADNIAIHGSRVWYGFWCLANNDANGRERERERPQKTVYKIYPTTHEMTEHAYCY